MKQRQRRIDCNKLFAQAVAAQQRGDFSRAARDLRTLLAAAPQLHQAWYSLGAVLYGQGHYPEALEKLAQAIMLQRDPHYLVAHAACLSKLGRLEEAHAQLGAGDGPSLIRRHRVYAEMGHVKRLQARFAEAEVYYRQATEKEPQNADHWANLGVVLTAQDRGHDAIAAYRQALQRNPRMAGIYNNLGKLLLDGGGSLAKAQAMLEQALLLEPGLHAARHNLATCASKQGRYEVARHELERCIDSQPDNAEYWASLAGLFWGMGRHAESIAASKKHWP